MFEGLINFFNGYEARLAFSCVRFIFCSDNHSVCARAYQLYNLVGVGDLETRTEQIVCLVTDSDVYIVH